VNFLSVTLLLIGGISCASRNRQDIPQNQNILAIVPFQLDASSVGLSTSIQGTIFVSGNKEKPNDRYINIVATLEIDPRDWGGVTISFPGSWDILTTTSSYPEGKPNPEDYLSFERVYDKPNPNLMESVTVGSNLDFTVGSGGGRGSLAFELKYALPKTPLSETINIGIGIGGVIDEINKVPIVYPCSITLKVPMSINGQTIFDGGLGYTTSIDTTAPGPAGSVTALPITVTTN
jgi:hypothetical protein